LRNVVIEKKEFWREVEEAEEFIEEEVRGAIERQEEGWRKDGKVLLWRERVYVPDSITLQEEIITKHHNSKLVSHLGYTKTYELITRTYWWPRMVEDVKRYVAGCERCQATKPNRQPRRNHLHPNEVPQNPWEIVSINLIEPLPESTGYNGILVIVDHFSKMAQYIPINMNITAQGVAKISWDRVFKDCQGRVEREWSDPEWSGVTPEWKRVDNKGGGTTLASARALCLDLLSRMWLRISGGLNCCQKSRKGVV